MKQKSSSFFDRRTVYSGEQDTRSMRRYFTLIELLVVVAIIAILAGILSGVFTSLAGVWVFSTLFHLDKQIYATLLPKSITTAIGMGISEELGGIVTITVAAIIITGIIGNMFGDVICRLCGIRHPIATGLAIGTATHAMGTAKAMEIGEIEGAMSSLSIAVAGLITVVGSTIFYQLY